MSDHIATSTNKSNAVQTALRLDIPVVPGSHGVVTSPSAALRIAGKIGYPVVLKAVHGGGGRGIAIVRRPEELRDAFLRTATEAQSAFGGRDLYIEKLIGRFRHVEVQIPCDRSGNTRVLGLRYCSVQRKHQKVIEESGATLLPDEVRDAAFKHARDLAAEVGYFGAGTIEFIFDLDMQRIYFMEMNARLQVEHPVTEATTGIDIVRQQFRIAAGESLEDLEVAESRHAIEVRINAERLVLDAESGLRNVPDPGTVSECVFPEMQNVRVISAIEPGSVVSDRSSIEVVDSDELKVVAVTPCVFYGAPGPGRAEFVTAGDRIYTDTTLCLMEAMKLFEELSLESFNVDEEIYPRHLEYEVVQVNARDGQLVTEGDLLLVVRPIDVNGHAA